MRTLAFLPFCRATVVFVALIHPAAARAHGDGPLARADVTTSIGWFGANRAEPGDCCGNWSASLFKGIAGSYYWTDHLRTDLEVGWPGPTEAFHYSHPIGPLGTPPTTVVYENHSYRSTKFSASQSYQFGRNAMVHPFVGAGLDVDRERDEVERVTQSARSSDRTTFTENEVRTRPFVTTGLKAYFTERAFFKGEVKVAVRERAEQVTWKSGIGIDLGGSPPARGRSATTARPGSNYPGDAPRSNIDPPELWRRYAAKLPIGATVAVQTTSGDRFAASLLAVDDTGVLLKPKTRMPEPVRHVAFDALERLEPRRGTESLERIGAVGLGVGAGTGTFLTLLFIALAHVD